MGPGVQRQELFIMTKYGVLEQKKREILHLQETLQFLNSIETGVLYKGVMKYYDFHVQHEWIDGIQFVIIETFSKLSCRTRIIASDNGQIQEGKNARRVRQDIFALNYQYPQVRLTPATKTDLGLIVGMAYKSKDVDKILNGKSKIRIMGG